MAALFEKHLEKIEGWLAQQPNFSVLYVPYHELAERAEGQLDRIVDFLDQALELPLDRTAMLAAVDPALYRNRA
jgi:hypothetical protein